jgi:serine phosphatase RsbU (regulator of sigma subunit)
LTSPSPSQTGTTTPDAALAWAILENQAVGTLVVDGDTVVTYANPMATEMLGVPPDRLIGEVFGLPLVSDSVTDVNVPGEGEPVRTLAMRVSELESDRAYRLVTLFDVSGRTRLYEHEHRLVETLQRSLLLERMPQLPGVRLAARYIPGEGAVRVGGDWYDAIQLPDGRLGLVIGDVAGHGLGSAALMSQLRNALRAYALEHSTTVEVVDRLDALLYHLEPRALATMVYLIYDHGSRRLSLTAAGHPYPLLATSDGHHRYLRGGRTLPLGADDRDERQTQELTVAPGSTLVLYTDGLIERRRRPLDDGFASLAAVIEPELGDPDRTCELIVQRLLGEDQPADDVAILVMLTS